MFFLSFLSDIYVSLFKTGSCIFQIPTVYKGNVGVWEILTLLLWHNVNTNFNYLQLEHNEMKCEKF